jgi:thiamine biosynthesis lipoprotein
MSPGDLCHFTFGAMGSPCAISLGEPGAQEIARAAIAEVTRVEQAYSRYLPDSIVSAINVAARNGAAIDVDPETAPMIDQAFDLYRLSDGLFDITSGPLRAAWNENAVAPPDASTLAEILGRIGLDKLAWKSPRLTFSQKGMEIDLGGIAKEYAADRAAALCRSMGAEQGIVDLGGDLALFGNNRDGSAWRVGVSDPDDPSRAVATLFIHGGGGVATSGIYQRFWELGGKRYGHLLNPRTGWPVEGLLSVTVVAESCARAGAQSTIAMLMGEQGAGWLARHAQAHVYVDRERRLGGNALDGSNRHESSAAQPSR